MAAAAAAAGSTGTVAAAAAAGLRNVAAAGGTATASPGDLVLLQGLLLQLWAPLQFLGWFYRCACMWWCIRGADQRAVHTAEEEDFCSCECSVTIADTDCQTARCVGLLQQWSSHTGLHRVSWAQQPPFIPLCYVTFVLCREVRQSLVDMEEFFDILKTQNSLPSGNVPLPDIPPSLANSFPAAALSSSHVATAASTAAASGQHDSAVLQERLLSHSQASSSNGHSTNGSSAGSSGTSSSSSHLLDQQDLVEAALLLEEQQHPQHSQHQQNLHNLGSSSFDVGMPDRSVAISGLGLEVELEDVRFGYQAERQVNGASTRCAVLCWALRMLVDQIRLHLRSCGHAVASAGHSVQVPHDPVSANGCFMVGC